MFQQYESADISRLAAPLSQAVGHCSDVEMKDIEPTDKRKPITLPEVREAYGPLGEKYPPVLTLELAAELSGYTASTLKKKVSEGCFKDSVSRGKPLLFWRDRFVLELMNRRWLRPVRAIRNAIQISTGGDNETH